MKQLKIKLHLLNDTAEIFDNTVELNNTSSGHYCLPLKETMLDIKEYNISFDKTDNKSNKYKILQKVHAEFAHPTKTKFEKLMVMPIYGTIFMKI